MMPMLNMRFVQPDHVIDLNKVDGLSYIREANGALEIGAMTRQRDIEFSDLVRQRCPLMHEAIQHVGHRQTRNRGTIGGSLCHLDPSAELVTVAAAMDATVTVQGPNGTREVEFAAFPVAFMTPAIELNELVTAVRFPLWPDDHGYGFVEFARRHGDFAIVSAAALLTEDARRQDHARFGHARRHRRGAGARQRGRAGADRPDAPTTNWLREACEACRKLRRDRRHPRAGLLSPASRDGDVAPRARSRRARGCRADAGEDALSGQRWARHARSR